MIYQINNYRVIRKFKKDNDYNNHISLVIETTENISYHQFDNDQNLIKLNNDVYRIHRLISCNKFYYVYLTKISNHKYKDNDPKRVEYEEGYMSCPSCGFFDIEDWMETCPQCDQKLLF